ncbi:hypothetical protein JOB18_006696 [Solea senegalensis]|uniref:Uncharacterized protein n=1 Tax=Solea senegalensis TaxID=28829 RepID=A0AAV6T3V8_SOLSE|nr:hypothetical protein JOB18_006696 [Solea senegalensis]
MIERIVRRSELLFISCCALYRSIRRSVLHEECGRIDDSSGFANVLELLRKGQCDVARSSDLADNNNVMDPPNGCQFHKRGAGEKVSNKAKRNLRINELEACKYYANSCQGIMLSNITDCCL